MRISSRNAVRILLFGVVPAALAWRLAYEEWLDAWLGALASSPPPPGAGLACADGGGRAAPAASSTAAVPRRRPTTPAMSASRRCGRVARRASTSASPRLPWPDASDTLTPLGYRIGAGGAMVPTYAPGLPLLMALARAAGVVRALPRGAVLRRAAGVLHFPAWPPALRHGTALAAAALVACSPVMVFMSLTPMADLPAAAFWIGAMAMAVRGTPTATVVAAIADGSGHPDPPESRAAGDCSPGSWRIVRCQRRSSRRSCARRCSPWAVFRPRCSSRGSTTCSTDRR